MTDKGLSGAFSKTRMLRLLIWGVVILCAAGLGALAYGVLLARDLGQYLSMQSLSDSVHRTAVLLMPIGLAFLALIWMLSELGKLAAVLRWTGRVFAFLAATSVFGTLVFIILFDSRLETVGMKGQFVTEKSRTFTTQSLPASDLHGFLRETSKEQAGLAVNGLSLGHIITLDRKTLARKIPGSSFLWSVFRPGPPPAYLSLDRDVIYYTGPGPDFDDDIVACAVKISTGSVLWLLHGLGNWASPVVSHGSYASFISARPSSSTVRLLRAHSPKVKWAIRLQGTVKIPPKFTDDYLQVALGGLLLDLSLDTGKELNRQEPCRKADIEREKRLGIVCKDGQVIAWRSGKSSNERPAIDLR